MSPVYTKELLEKAKPFLLFDKFREVKPEKNGYWDDLAWYCQTQIDMRHFKRVKWYCLVHPILGNIIQTEIGTYTSFRFIDGGRNGQA